MPLLYTLFGAVFGFVLSRAGAADYTFIQSTFLFQSFQLYGIMGTAVVITAPGLWLLKRRGRTLSGRPLDVELKPFNAGSVAGGLLFGIGWSIAGMCPGPILVNIGEGKVYALAALAGAVCGAALFGALYPVQDDWSGSKNYYIADNVFIGRHDPDRMMGWIGQIWERFPGFPELLSSEYAVKVYGQGHVVAHNFFAHWHDGVDVATYGDPDGAPDAIPDRLPVSIDFYGNDIFNATGQDRHSVIVDYDVFVNVAMPDRSDPQRLYKPDALDFRLRPGSAAIDAGTLLPTINDDFTGRAPDIGAYELDRPLPRYGPR